MIKDMEELDKYVKWLSAQYDYSQSTLMAYRDRMKSFFGKGKEFSQDEARRYVKELITSGVPARTVTLTITAIEKYGAFLGQEVKIKRPKVQRSLSLENVPSEEEYKMLCEHLRGLKTSKGNDYYLLVKLLGTTGLRISEVKGITYEDIQRGSKLIIGKGTKYRIVFFTDELKSYAEGKIGICFPMTPRAISCQLKKYADKIGLDRAKIHPHAFRHFFAKQFLRKSGDVVELANILGHGSLDTTRIYLQRSNEERRQFYKEHVCW